MMFNDLRQRLVRDGDVSFAVSVRPSAPHTKAKSAMADGTIKIDIAAAPEDGAANTELVRFLSEEFGIARSAVEIVSGQTSRKKIVRVRT